jgi:hypothetical protein
LDADHRRELLVEAVAREVLEGVVLAARRLQHPQRVLHPRDGRIDPLLRVLADASERVPEVHRVDVGTAAEEIEARLAAGLHHERVSAGAACDLDRFADGFDLGRDDEGARLERTQHVEQHGIVGARRLTRPRRPEDHRVAAQVLEAEDDARVLVAER